jgi:hypothetical protein
MMASVNCFNHSNIPFLWSEDKTKGAQKIKKFWGFFEARSQGKIVANNQEKKLIDQ